jgi:MoxR-like ATPase
MQTINAGRELIQLASACHRADIPLLIEGRHGVGKSELLVQCAKEMAIGIKVRDLSVMEPCDLVGIPILEGKLTQFCPPAFLPKRGKGLFVIEELNRAPVYMRAHCLQLLTSRRINDYRLPVGWLPVAAINPDDEAYDTSQVDAALRSRFLNIRVVPSRREWLAWADSQKLHPSVVQYVASDPSVFDDPTSNPRAWTYVAHFLSKNSNGSVAEPLLAKGIAGLVGNNRAASFLSFLETQDKPLDAKAVLDDYNAHRSKFKGWVKQGRLDLVKSSLLAVEAQLQAKVHFQRIRQSSKKRANVRDFLADLPPDLRVDLMGFLDERGYEVPKEGRRVAC